MRQGPDAIGGLGDWALQNGTLCAVVSGRGHESDLSEQGGSLVDLGFCDRPDDQFVLYLEVLNNEVEEAVIAERIEASVDDDVARLTVFGGRGGATVETRYELDREQPRRIRIQSRVTRTDDAIDVTGLSGVLANVRGLSPFVVSTTGTATSHGYAYPPYSGLGLGALIDAATAADLVVGVGAADLEPGVAYGQRMVSATVRDEDGETEAVPTFYASDALATVSFAFARPFWLGDDDELGLFRLLQVLLMNLPDGSELVVEREIWVGDRADAASVTNQLFSDAPLVTGEVSTPGAVLHVDRPQTGPFTEVRVDEEGRFSLRLPAGDYEARLVAPGRRERRFALAVPPEGRALGALDAGPAGEVILPRGSPMRLVFIGLDGTPDPHFEDDLRGHVARSDDEPDEPIVPPQRSIHRTGTANEPSSAVLAPGRYRVLATRGPEFSLESTTLEVPAGEAVTLEIDPPRRVLETPGFVASDFHIHSAPSLDNASSSARQVANTIAEGGEVLIATEHEHVFDFAPTIREMGLGDELPSVVGLEVTSEVRSEAAPQSVGHANVFPMPVDPLAYRRGAVANEGRRWRDIIADLRALPGERVIQLNHARFRDEEAKGAFLSHMSPAGEPYDPEEPLTSSPNRTLIEPDPRTGVRDLDIDAMELLNGPHYDSYEFLREDWFSFLRQGERIVGTANSDSHYPATPIGAPRNYVAYEGDVLPPSKFDEARFVDAVRAGRTYGTTGPIVGVRLNEAGLGETLQAGDATLFVAVDASDWIDVSELRVYVSGKRVSTHPITKGARLEIPLAFETDAFVTTEVWGEPSEDYAAVLPKFVPFAFTNPIWVDANGDGEWTPPGVD